MFKRIFVAMLAVLLLSTAAYAEDYTVYVLCNPDSFVNVRAFPKTGAEVAGRVEVGQELQTDGAKRNGFLHLVGTGFEAGDTWIYAGYVTREPVTVQTIETQVVSRGRVACRRAIKGTRRKWLKNGQKTVIFAYASDWA